MAYFLFFFYIFREKREEEKPQSPHLSIKFLTVFYLSVLDYYFRKIFRQGGGVPSQKIAKKL
jgi:hypothetical protein